MNMVNLQDLPDGDYPTGNTRDKWMNSQGKTVWGYYPEVMIIKNHRVIGFRQPDGNAIMLPSLDDEPLTKDDLPPKFGE